MAYCRNCGAEIHDEAVVCVNCGVAVELPKKTNPNDKKSGGFAFLCFLIPILGLILYLVWKDDYPLKAKSCAKGAIVGVVLGLIGSIIGGILGAVIGMGTIAYLEDPALFESYEYLMINFR
ncbi:MAG: zinc ribbon domain-containing protein [Clostridia bacterium]|nr:zinc ribbon domain-containing protein [Clostridia bacterium]